MNTLDKKEEKALNELSEKYEKFTNKGFIINRRSIKISKKRQITIPLEFYNQLGFENEVECSLEDGAVVIRPFQEKTYDLSVDILKDLTSQGYTGDELVSQFKKLRKDIKTAVSNLLEEADCISSDEKNMLILMKFLIK